MAALEQEQVGVESDAVSPAESAQEMKRRHKKELKDLQGQNRKRIKEVKRSGGKGLKEKIAAVETECMRSEDQLNYRQHQELLAIEGEESEEEPAYEPPPPPPETAKSGGADAVAKKKNKAQRKRDKQRQKEKEREERIAREKENMVSPREVELEAISVKLANEPTPLVVHEVDSDGHCLYRAIDHQLTMKSLRPVAMETVGYKELRRLAARHMRENAGDFMPFLDLSVFLQDGDEGTTAAFGRYCNRVEGSADWGGHTELLALSNVLAVPIRVHSADAPPVLVGEGHGTEDDYLQLTFHQHFLALGEHYNSTRPL